MKRILLKVLMVLALGAIICLPGVAAADPIFLDFEGITMLILLIILTASSNGGGRGQSQHLAQSLTQVPAN